MGLDPASLRYSREHEWLAVQSSDGVDGGDGDTATVGITDYAQHELGDVVYVDLPSSGATITQFAKLGEIESVKSVSDIFCPVSGEVVEENTALEDRPELVNEDPYGEGWMVRIKLTDPQEVANLLSHDDYQALLRESAGD